MTIYDSMEFPEYEYREFPKMVYPEGVVHPDDHPEIHLRGKPRGFEVHNVEEERGILSAHNALESEPAGRAEIRRQLSTLGVQVDPMWDMARLYQELGRRASALSQQFKSVSGSEAPKKEVGVAEFGHMPDEHETTQRYKESFGRSGQIEQPNPVRPSEMDELKEQAAALDIKVDGRWSADRLRQEIRRVTEPDMGSDYA